MTDFFAFYGTLRRDAADIEAPSGDGLVAYRGPCRLAGTLRAHGPYPGLFPAASHFSADPLAAASLGPDGIVAADLFAVLRPEAFPVFDGWEAYDPANEAGSLYLRRRIRPIDVDFDVWVYVSRQSTADPLIEDGDWLAHLARSSSP